MQLIVYTDPDVTTDRDQWSGVVDNMVTHVGDPNQWSAGDVERVRDKVFQWLAAQPLGTTTATRAPVTEKSAPRRYRDGSLYEPTMKVGVQIGANKAWVEITGLRPEVIEEVLRRQAESQAEL